MKVIKKIVQSLGVETVPLDSWLKEHNESSDTAVSLFSNIVHISTIEISRNSR